MAQIGPASEAGGTVDNLEGQSSPSGGTEALQMGEAEHTRMGWVEAGYVSGAQFGEEV